MKLISLFLFLLISLPCLASVEKLDLKSSIDMAMVRNAELKAQRFQEKQAASDLDRIEGEFGPHLEAEIGVGPITKAQGDATAAVENKSSWGRTYLGNIHFTQPLYSWGRKTKYIQAAEAGEKVKKEDTKLKENEIRFEVKEAYYGVLYTASLLDFIQDGKKDLQKALDDTKKKQKEKEKENFRLELFVNEVAGKEAEVQQHYEIAKAGFALRVANAEPGMVIPKDEWLIPQSRKLESLDYYLAIAKDSRPEFRQLSLGITAKHDLASAEWKGLLPVFGFLLGYDYANTNVRTPQPGVFAYDPYNRHVLTAGLGFKLDLQYGIQRAKAEKATAEAEELEAKQEFANEGIAVDLRRAYLELTSAEKRLDAAVKSYKMGKKWLTGELLAYGTGLGHSKELVDAYGARAETAKNYFEALYQNQMAWAALSRAAGREVDPLLQ